jgi:hypothetical protein
MHRIIIAVIVLTIVMICFFIWKARRRLGQICRHNTIRYGIYVDHKLGPLHDVDAAYLTSREKMGAFTPKTRNRGRVNQGHDTIFDGDARVHQIHNRTDINTLNLLYGDVMGLGNPPPYSDDCEYVGLNGYIYKEPCSLYGPGG